MEFPPISHLVEWPSIFGGDSWYAFNKIALINVLAVIATLGIFFLAGRKRALVPTGVQNVAESSIDFIEDGIVMQTMGPDGLKYTPFLTAIFFFVFFGNITEIIPVLQMPANARMANPLMLALIVFIVFNVVGIAKQGFFGYFKSSLFPPGVPKALYILVVPIEFVSTFVIRPFSLAVRLFANLLAGHILLVTFAVISATLLAANALVAVLPLSFAMLVALTGFEVLVSILQAYIFAILTAVYIGGAMHPEH